MLNLKTSISKARFWLAFVWILFALINIGIIFYLHFADEIEGDNFKAALSQLNLSYAPYLGIILTFFWSDRKKNRSRKNVSTSFIIAMIFSTFWNILILIPLIKLLFLNGFIEDSIQSIKLVNNYLVWLVAGAIGYYFGRS